MLFFLFSCTYTGSIPSFDGVDIAFEIRGECEESILKPVLVFVHGWCCNRTYWDVQLEEFSKDYIVVAIDLGGHGESGLGRAKWTTEAYGQDVVAVVKELKLREIILIGHSMGGIVSLEAACHLPENVIGLVGVDVFHNVEQVLPPPETMIPFYTALRLDFVGTASAYIAANMFIPESDPALKQQIITDMTTPPPEVEVAVNTLEEGYIYAYNGNIRSGFNQMQVPIRCINSDAYPYDIEAGKRNTLSFDMIHMSNVGHFVMLEDPVTFNQLLSDTIEEIIAF